MVDGDRAQIFALAAVVLALLALLFSPFLAFILAAVGAVLGFATRDEVGFPLFAQLGFFGGSGLAALVLLVALVSWVAGMFGGGEAAHYQSYSGRL
jgi:uncharacterized membrane protein